MPERQRTLPPDHLQRESALDATRSVLVRAPAGSGKTDLLTRRFLRLLSEVNDPGEIVAITFTKAAAAEMRHRILTELEKAASGASQAPPSAIFSMESLAQQALARSRTLGWNLIELPAQLRISTIDSFCREIAMQEPILSGLGGSFEIYEQPRELYRRAARRTLQQIGKGEAVLSGAIERLLLWRDNNWADLENQIVEMLARRDQWMQENFLDRAPDWDAMRRQLERPFARAIRPVLTGLDLLFEQIPGGLTEAHELARFACDQSGGALHGDLAELAEFPSTTDAGSEQLEEARRAYCCIAELLLTKGSFRQKVDKRHGFPAEAKQEKNRLIALIAELAKEPAFNVALAAVRDLPSARYTDEDWEIVRASFILLRHAAGELRVAFAETAKADFIEIAQIAQRALKGEDDLPADAAQIFADRIHHLLVDEFQDTSRRQHRLLAHLIAAWSGREGRSCFVVGDPMQSIYGFRDADAELFPRVEHLGLEIPGDLPLAFDAVQLFANFRSASSLIEHLNHAFSAIFTEDGGSGIVFTSAQPARDGEEQLGPHPVDESSPRLGLHLSFMPVSCTGAAGASFEDWELLKKQRGAALEEQTEKIVALIRSHLQRMDDARAAGEKYRIAVLGRARTALTPIARALRKAAIPFRAIELESLRDRPEIIDALALVRALFNPEDRVAWLGLLRAPWCGLSLADLHMLIGADDEQFRLHPVPDLVSERAPLLSTEGRIAAARVIDAVAFAGHVQSGWPTAALGTRMEQIWLRLGGAHCVDPTARANLDLFWRCLDDLPQGESDLLGSALDTALTELCALPDPAASADCGVQLMTMHGAKGLEFEVVIVPELQANSGGNKPEMLSWLERGLAPDAEPDTDEVTEFLVAPFPPKGDERGSAKAWVDRIRREREQQEMRRIFYVAATRAREELHLFARPEFKSLDAGSLQLCSPRESLLKTAWPAFGEEIERRFEEWKIQASTPSGEALTIESLAASAENLLAMPPPGDASPLRPTRVRRLSSSYRPASQEIPASEAPLMGAGNLYERHDDGSFISRALGKAVHELLQGFAELRATQVTQAGQAPLTSLLPRITANLRASGFEASEARRIAAQAHAIVLAAAADPQAQWILASHADAASEVRWTGVISGALRTVQIDRVFRAGPLPHSTHGDIWWIVDYKTADYKIGTGEVRDRQNEIFKWRSLFAPQIEAYAKVLRNLHGAHSQVRGALYYPRMKLLDWWEL